MTSCPIWELSRLGRPVWRSSPASRALLQVRCKLIGTDRFKGFLPPISIWILPICRCRPVVIRFLRAKLVKLFGECGQKLLLFGTGLLWVLLGEAKIKVSVIARIESKAD